MPELPEVEVLVRYLRPLLINQSVRKVEVRRAKIISPVSSRRFAELLHRTRFTDMSRRGKYLIFTLRRPGTTTPTRLIGHLGMTGRMYLTPLEQALPKHAAAVLNLGRCKLVFEDTRYFGRLTFDARALQKLGLEPLSDQFTPEALRAGLRRSRQPVKVKLLDQSLVAGLGNIYASEALFRAGISPRKRARTLNEQQVLRLWRSIREVLSEAINWGSTVPTASTGLAKEQESVEVEVERGEPFVASEFNLQKLMVYGRSNQPCSQCGGVIKRVVQAGRSTFYCPRCQKA